ncbi:hypothetical protein CCH79_00019153, partial [Gambusia affinis]
LDILRRTPLPVSGAPYSTSCFWSAVLHFLLLERSPVRLGFTYLTEPEFTSTESRPRFGGPEVRAESVNTLSSSPRRAAPLAVLHRLPASQPPVCLSVFLRQRQTQGLCASASPKHESLPSPHAAVNHSFLQGIPTVSAPRPPPGPVGPRPSPVFSCEALESGWPGGGREKGGFLSDGRPGVWIRSLCVQTFRDSTSVETKTQTEQEPFGFDSVLFLTDMKTGPFAEHSNQLWNISAVPSWSKVNQGLIRMYKAELNHLRCLQDFAEAQATYFAQCHHYMQDLQRELNRCANSAVGPPPPSGAGSDPVPTAFPSGRLSPGASGSRKAKVLYDYDAHDTSELSLLADEVSLTRPPDHDQNRKITGYPQTDQVITVYTVPGMDPDWLVGERGNEKGKVPVTYLELLS